jgi:hypothetical protein
MNRALGYAQYISPEETIEIETFTCRHCNSIVRMQPDVTLKSLEKAIVSGKEVRDIRRCHSCDALICPKCFKEPTCVEFERRLEAYERGERLIIAANG